MENNSDIDLVFKLSLSSSTRIPTLNWVSNGGCYVTSYWQWWVRRRASWKTIESPPPSCSWLICTSQQSLQRRCCEWCACHWCSCCNWVTVLFHLPKRCWKKPRFSRALALLADVGQPFGLHFGVMSSSSTTLETPLLPFTNLSCLFLSRVLDFSNWHRQLSRILAFLDVLVPFYLFF